MCPLSKVGIFCRNSQKSSGSSGKLTISSTLTAIESGLSPTPNLKKGDVVFCKDLGEFANHTSPLARIEEVQPGSDDQVRVVILRVGKKLLIIPTYKVILLVPDLEE